MSKYREVINGSVKAGDFVKFSGIVVDTDKDKLYEVVEHSDHGPVVYDDVGDVRRMNLMESRYYRIYEPVQALRIKPGHRLKVVGKHGDTYIVAYDEDEHFVIAVSCCGDSLRIKATPNNKGYYMGSGGSVVEAIYSVYPQNPLGYGYVGPILYTKEKPEPEPVEFTVAQLEEKLGYKIKIIK